MAQNHLNACPWHTTGLLKDCSCDKEVGHYLKLAKWSFGLFSFEMFVGWRSGSVALMSDAVHVLMDGAENIVSAIISMLARKHTNEKQLREIGGRISALLLLIVAGLIIHEGYERFLIPSKVEWYMTIAAIIGLGVNLRMRKLHQEVSKEHKNYTHFWQDWHLISDTVASVAVIVGGIIMLVDNELYWIDGVLSIGIGTLIIVLVIGKLLGFDFHSHNNETGRGHHHHH